MKCRLGYLIGHDYEWHIECKTECEKDTLDYCRRYFKSCINKADFGSQIIANKVAKEMTAEDQVYGPYKCVFCSGWHIGRESNNGIQGMVPNVK